jgi:hypothetical protein
MVDADDWSATRFKRHRHRDSAQRVWFAIGFMTCCLPTNLSPTQS